MPNAVFLVDLMLRDDLAELIDGRVSREGTKEVLRAADAIRQVQRMLGHPLPEVVREAIVALNLDIDMQLAEHMRGGQADATLAASRVALAKSPIDALLKLVDVYAGDRVAGNAEPARVHLMGGFAARRTRGARGGSRCACRRGADDRTPVEGP